MENFSDVLKIVEGGLKFNAQTVVNYTQALIKKLQRSGQAMEAQLLQAKLDGAEPSLMTYGASTAPSLPVDQESQMDLAMLERISPQSAHAVLEPLIRAEVDRFLSYVRAGDRLAAAGVAVSPQMLIYGPPGVGKTQLARHIAAELDLPLLTARCDGLISSYLGSTAKNIRRLFDHARERPCVLFLDEFDALAKARDDRQELGELKRVVVSLLQNIDCLPPQSVVIAATNHEQLLDPAVWRRFAYHIHLDLPRAELREALLKSYLTHYAPSESLQPAVTISEGLSGAGLREAAEEAIRHAVIMGGTRVDLPTLLFRIAQTALLAQGLSPDAERLAEHLLDSGVPLRLAAQSSGLSMRKINHISTERRLNAEEKIKGENRLGRSEKSRGTRAAPSAGTTGKTRRR